MNKEHFLTELKIQLRGLQPVQRQAVLADYEAQFDALLAEGLSEPHVSKKLGDPVEIAQEILAEWQVSPDRATTNGSDWQEFDPPFNNDPRTNDYQEKPSFFVRFCQIAGIVLFNLLLMVWLIVAGLSLIFAGWLVVITCLLAPILGLIALALTAGTAGLFQLFVSIALCGLGFLGLLIAIPVTKYTFKFLYHYIMWNLNVLRGDH